MNQLRYNKQRAQWAVTMIGIVLIVEILNLVSSLMQYELLVVLSKGGFISDNDIYYNDLREQVAGIIYLVVLGISLYTFIRWFRRAYFNLHLKADVLNYSEGWAAGSWFVPIINLVRPYKIMKELHNKTNLMLETNNKESEVSHINIINIWWALWIVNSVIGNIAFRMSRNSQTIDDLTNVTIVTMISEAIGIPLAVVTITMIKKQHEKETRFAEVFNSNNTQQQAKIIAEFSGS